MLRIRLNALNSSEIKKPLVGKKNIYDLLKETMEIEKVDGALEEYFVAMCDGVLIDRKYWKSFYPKETSDVVIAIVPKGGSFREIVRGTLIAAITVAAFVFSGGNPWAAAGANIGATLLFNAILPPQEQGIAAAGVPSTYSESQMFAINSQSNSPKKYGFAPKIYGTHRFIPYVAANSYTEIEPDPNTGELVQYFYCIYDFGLGPAIVTDLRIGESAFALYNEISYRMVDPNRPAIAEGSWDESLNNAFELYKGDVETTQVGVTLNGNQAAGSPSSEFEATRECPGLSNGDEQEIIVDFVFQAGLVAYNSASDRTTCYVEYKIEFAPVGTEDWSNYNDESVVKSFRGVGGQSTENKSILNPLLEIASFSTDINFIPGAKYYDRLFTIDLFNYDTYSIYNVLNLEQYTPTKMYQSSFGYQAGRTSIVLRELLEPEIILKRGSQTIGKIQSRVDLGGGLYEYELYEPLQQSISIFDAYESFDGNNAGVVSATKRWNVYGIYQTGSAAVGNVTFNNRFAPVFYIVVATGGILRVAGNTTNALYATARFTPTTSGEYKVRVRRYRTFSSFNYQIVSSSAWLNLTSRFDRQPIKTNKRHVFMELRIKATNQLNGSVSNLSGVVTSVLDVYRDGAWTKEPTSNPAWIFTDLLTGQVNKRAVDKSRLDLDSLLEWEEFSNEVPTPPPSQDYTYPRFQINFILDFPTTLQELINKVAGQCQASINVIDGRYGVLIDKLKVNPVQLFTPRNSWGFASSRTYTDLPDGVKIKYVDPVSDWDLNEITAYNDGKTLANSETFDQLDCFGVTNFEQAYRYGRYMLAQAKLRKETISLNVDFENLVCTRGDYVKVTSDVMRAGGTPARVTSVVSNVITTDESIVELPVSYGYTFRNSSGVLHTSTLNIVSPNTFEVNGNIPAKGDLIVIGEIDKITIDCLVKSIIPRADFSAELILVEKADAVYEAESLDVIPEYNPNLSEDIDSDLAAPGFVGNLTIQDDTYRCNGSAYEYFINLTWEAPTQGSYELFEIYVDRGQGYELYDYSSILNYEFIVDQNYLGVEHNFKVLAVSANGKKKNIGDVVVVATTTPLSKSVPPSDVQSLSINITGEVIQLSWQAVSDCDVLSYLIRYSPTYSGTWEASIPLLNVDKSTTLASAQARTGTYLIKAIDFNGNQSTVAAMAITSIPALLNLNIIEETNDFPSLPGTFDKVSEFGDALILQKKEMIGPPDEYYEEGYYYFQNFLDLGEIYTVRLQSLIEAEGFTDLDLMANWITLADVLTLSGSQYSDWNVETQFRSTDEFNTISAWPSLDVIDNMGQGADNWGPWTQFVMGDFTGRIFQFRLKLISFKPSVTPRVFDGIIKSDMPDRTESDNDVLSDVAGTEIEYSVPFKGPGTSPNIQITQDDAEQGDYYKFNYKNLEGFKITFYDVNENPVERQFDYFVKGYGRRHDAVI